MKHIIQLFSGVMEDIQEKAKFKMKNKGKEAMESWREFMQKLGVYKGSEIWKGWCIQETVES